MPAKPEQINVRIPHELRVWLKEQSALNRSSLSSEVTRCIRERKLRSESAGRASRAYAERCA